MDTKEHGRIDMLDYQGKRVLVVGGATGMGAAAAQKVAELGAEITVLDVAEVDYPANAIIHVDLRDKDGVDAALARLDGPYDALFSCAGIADGTPGVMLVNFISQRYLIEGLVAKGALRRGSSIAAISSTAGNGWQAFLPQINELLAIPDWQGQTEWVAARKSDDYMTNADGYMFSKRSMCAYVAQQGVALLKQGIRINAILPGPTDTPLARANAHIWLAYASDFRAEVGVTHLQPREMGDVLIFLCSPMASGITGENIVVDHGYTTSQVMGTFTS
jgi:NAD(P)-dependent dehydrogenase (short-subunit alcohol dehydrogenase family)